MQTGVTRSGLGARGQANTPLLLGFDHFPHRGEAVELREAVPLLDGGSAEVRVALCTPPYGDRTLVGTDVGTLEEVCTEVLPVEAATYQHPFGADTVRQLVLEVTPRSSEPVLVNGLRVKYRDGIRRGTALVGPRAKVEVSER